jgi:hypothetical protein
VTGRQRVYEPVSGGRMIFRERTLPKIKILNNRRITVQIISVVMSIAIICEVSMLTVAKDVINVPIEEPHSSAASALRYE